MGSPLAAYHARSRRFLVLDVWPDTEPSWLDADALVAAMRAVDSESGLSRGWLQELEMIRDYYNEQYFEKDFVASLSVWQMEYMVAMWNAEIEKRVLPSLHE